MNTKDNFEATVRVALRDIDNLNKSLSEKKTLKSENIVLGKIIFMQNCIIRMFQEKYTNNQAKNN